MGGIRAAVAVVGVCVMWSAGGAASAAGQCPNEAFRTGRSASLPDCRAYELVTPPELGRTADMTFEHNHDKWAVSGYGEHLLLEAEAAFLEPGVSLAGTKAVFSRTPSGWTMRSLTQPTMAEEENLIRLFSPDFSQVGLVSYRETAHAATTLEFGPAGGPYSTVSIPSEFGGPGQVGETEFVGANAGVAGVPAFSDVLIKSPDHVLLPRGPEREAAEGTKAGYDDLYEWSEEGLRLVNVNREGKLLNPCGAHLGSGEANKKGSAVNAVSADGSRVIFTSPQANGLPGCSEPQLYMHVNGRESVDISEPEGVSIPPSERGSVGYEGTSSDGSRVFFTTDTPLTPGTGGGLLLYEYDAEAPVGERLTLISNEVDRPSDFVNPGAVVSEDGSTIYYEAKGAIYRYDAITGMNSFVAIAPEPIEPEPWYTTPDGSSFVFPSGGGGNPAVKFYGPNGRLQEESRGVGHDELYRYDAADGSVMCVSCGPGVAPVRGWEDEPEQARGYLVPVDGSRNPVSISEDGRRVFFQSSAQLVLQDTNETSVEEEDLNNLELGAGADTYEWEQNGTEEAPGVVCEAANGCTHLISAGEDVGPEWFLGASVNGENVFFVSAAQLVPQATPEFTNIYDARVDGGFPPSPPSVECTSCQGVGSPPPSFSTPASVSFEGAGNPMSVPPLQSTTKSVTKTSAKRCGKGRKLSHGGRCVVQKKVRRKARARKAGHGAGRGRS